MSRNIHLRNHRDISLGSIIHDVLDLLLCIVTTINGTVPLLSVCTNGSQLRIFLDLDAPTLVFRQVEVHGVDLEHRHDVDFFLHILHGHEMATRIHMKTTITETRSILYVTALSHPFHTRHFGWAFYLGRQQLHKTLHAIKSALSRLCLDSHTLGRNSQSITFLSHLHRRRDLDGDVRLLCPHVHLITSRGIQLIGKILGNSLSLSSVIGNSHLLWQDKLT